MSDMSVSITMKLRGTQESWYAGPSPYSLTKRPASEIQDLCAKYTFRDVKHATLYFECWQGRTNHDVMRDFAHRFLNLAPSIETLRLVVCDPCECNCEDITLIDLLELGSESGILQSLFPDMDDTL